MSTDIPNRVSVVDNTNDRTNTVEAIDRDLTAIDNAEMVCSILEEHGHDANYFPESEGA